MQKDYLSKQQPNLIDWKYPKLAKRDSDGGYCYVIQRRISCYFSIYFKKLGLTPSQATLIDLAFGCLAALSIVFQYYLLSIFFIWMFGIWSCVDGEIARLSNQCSLSGDFFDTMTDRVVEMSVIIASYWSFYTAFDQVDKYLALTFITYLGGVYLLSVSSEKYRSVVHDNYPKKEAESLFSWISSGSDIRLFWLSVVIYTFWVLGSQDVMTLQIGVLSAIFFSNFAIRMIKVKSLLTIKTLTLKNTSTAQIGSVHSNLKIRDKRQIGLPIIDLARTGNEMNQITARHEIHKMKNSPILAAITPKHELSIHHLEKNNGQ